MKKLKRSRTGVRRRERELWRSNDGYTFVVLDGDDVVIRMQEDQILPETLTVPGAREAVAMTILARVIKHLVTQLDAKESEH